MQKQAYSYARFSTPRQTYGTSLERQLKIACEWYAQEIAPLGIPLAKIACDEGLSAWKGEHVEQGSLGHFLAEVKSGSVAPGSILIAENLDRISRQGPKIARKLLERIVDNGVSVHIVNAGDEPKAAIDFPMSHPISFPESFSTLPKDAR